MTATPITTLAHFQAYGRAIHAYCSHYWVCSHDAQLRLDILAAHLGWSFDFYAGREHLARRLRCSICGWSYPSFALGHAGTRAAFAGSHGAGTVPLSQEELIRLQRERELKSRADMRWVGTRKGGRKFGR